MNTFMGIKIVVSHNATKLVYNWPEKKRSRRLIKKMTKRLGPQVTIEPAAYTMADGRMCVHPAVYDSLRRQSTIDTGETP
jgi:hypothetical protein